MDDHSASILESVLYPIGLIFTICYPIPWLMHLCALLNARLKLNKPTRPQPSRSDQSRAPTSWPQPALFRQWTHKLLTCFGTNNLGKNNTNKSPATKRYATPTAPSEPIVQQLTTTDPFICAISNVSNLPGVSIIKPLLGVDTNLKSNLVTFFHLDYPKYELLFCVQDPDDDAVSLVQELITCYPMTDAKLFIGGASVGVNPKINNMQPAYEASKYGLILISDSGISMKKDTLLEMVVDMRDNVALIHQMPFVLDGRDGFHSIVEKVFFGTAHARAYLTADLLGINCPTGMSALMRKHLLDEVGGIKSFGQYLAEDFFFAKSFTDRGWEISIGRQPAWQNSSSASDTFCTFSSRIERWIKLRFAMVPLWTLLEPLSECMLLGVLQSVAYCYLWAFNPYTFFIAHFIVWLLLDYTLLRTIQNGPLDINICDFTRAWLVRECTALYIFIKALTNPLVIWRSRVFRLRWGGYAEEVTSNRPVLSSHSTSITVCQVCQ